MMFLDHDEAFESVQQLSIAIYLQYLACIEKLLIKCAKCTEGPSKKRKKKNFEDESQDVLPSYCSLPHLTVIHESPLLNLSLISLKCYMTSFLMEP